MSLLYLVLVLVVVGVLLGLLNRWGPQYIDGKMIWFINAIVVVCVVFFILGAFGLLHYAEAVKVPQVR